MPDLKRRFDRWMYEPAPAAPLAATVAAFAVLIALRLAFWPWGELAGLRRPLLDPVPFLRFLDEVPGEGVLVAIQITGVAAAVLAVVGWRRRLTFALAWTAFLVLAGFRASRGKIQHNDLLVLVAAAPFLAAVADARVRSTGSALSARFGWPRRAASVFVASAYLAAGLRKLTIAGPEWVTGDTMRWIMYRGAAGRRSPFPDLAQFVADRAWLSTAAAAGVVALELGFPLVLWFARLRPLVVAAAVAFHVGTWLTLGLDYWSYAAVVVILFANWDKLLGHPGPGSPAE